MNLKELKQRMRIPVIAAPMFIVSGPELVIAQCKAGIVGSFPALNARPAEVLEQWIQRITAELAEHDRQHPERGKDDDADGEGGAAERPPEAVGPLPRREPGFDPIDPGRLLHGLGG